MTDAGTGTDLVRWRAAVEEARSTTTQLDLLLSPTDAAACIRSLPGEQLYRIIRRVGLEDCTEIVGLSSGAQVQACLDFDAWDGDRLSVERLDPWLRSLLQAGMDTFVDRMRDLDDQLLSAIIRKSAHILVIDDPESFDPPDEEHVLTQDRRICIVFPESSERDLPVKVFLDGLMREDPDHCYNLLVFTGAALDAELEETAFRWRQGRLADLGFVDPIEALGIYTPPRPDQLAEARRAVPKDASATVLAPSLRGDERLKAALMHLSGETAQVVQQELAYVANTALSADRVPLWDEAAQETVLRRVRTGLALGLDALSTGGGAAGDAEVLARVPLALVFRTGYARVLDAAEPARRARRRGLLAASGGPVEAVDLPLLKRWVEALTDRHPHLPDGRLPRSAQDLEHMRAFAALVGDLVDFPAGGRPDEAGLCAWVLTQVVRSVLGLEGSGPLPVGAVVRAHGALFTDGHVSESQRSAVRAAFLAAGGRRPATIDALLAWAEEELGAVAPEAIEPRFCAPLVLGG
jgi:hypothetical protein